MKTQAIATVENGQLTLDQPLDLPDRSRVRLNFIHGLLFECGDW